MLHFMLYQGSFLLSSIFPLVVSLSLHMRIESFGLEVIGVYFGILEDYTPPIYLADKFFYQFVDFIRLVGIGIMTGILYPFKR